MENLFKISLFKETISRELYQHDKGQKCEIVESVPTGTQVLLSTSRMAEALRTVVVGNQFDVPDELLEHSGMLTINVEVVGEDSETTIYTLSTKVRSRKEASEVIPPEHQPTFIEQIEGIMEATEQIANSVRDEANAGRFNGKDGKDGKDGKNGKDGFSPEAKVERVEDGVKVTIKDSEKETTAIVKDGKDGTLTPEEKEALIEEVKEDVKDDFYTKTEMDEAFDFIDAELSQKADNRYTYTKSQVDAIISTVKNGEFSYVDELPIFGQVGIMYLVPKKNAESEDDVRDEYVWNDEDKKYERVGSTSIKVDTSLSATSENPVQNKAIFEAFEDVKKDVGDSAKDIEELQDGVSKIETDTTIQLTSDNVITRGQMVQVISGGEIQVITMDKRVGRLTFYDIGGNELSYENITSVPMTIIVPSSAVKMAVTGSSTFANQMTYKMDSGVMTPKDFADYSDSRTNGLESKVATLESGLTALDSKVDNLPHILTLDADVETSGVGETITITVDGFNGNKKQSFIINMFNDYSTDVDVYIMVNNSYAQRYPLYANGESVKGSEIVYGASYLIAFDNIDKCFNLVGCLNGYDDTEIRELINQQSSEIAKLNEALIGLDEAIGGVE